MGTVTVQSQIGAHPSPLTWSVYRNGQLIFSMGMRPSVTLELDQPFGQQEREPCGSKVQDCNAAPIAVGVAVQLRTIDGGNENETSGSIGVVHPLYVLGFGVCL
ncbi:hypothetical protein [Bradyrhizobium sp. CB2312]|uniref:hypothetical protein n=1 Tax=Bradyrhizobium sp. CB2312 TaxID=3039155 RepID=UPI0024B1B599|nr:hypothetical protein [Bradyrhizobium sp. CB2312]WFU74845.1 hypothetical protein QA642_12725 [Bradyrhizobium sp. CB2312]